MTSHIYRAKDGAIAGVCKGLATRLEVDVVVLRVIWVLAFLFAGAGLILYVILAISLPSEDELEKAYEPLALGVCARFAKRAKIDVGIVRASACVLFIFSFGTAVIGYFIAHFILPKENNSSEKVGE